MEDGGGQDKVFIIFYLCSHLSSASNLQRGNTMGRGVILMITIRTSHLPCISETDEFDRYRYLYFLVFFFFSDCKLMVPSETDFMNLYVAAKCTGRFAHGVSQPGDHHGISF